MDAKQGERDDKQEKPTHPIPFQRTPFWSQSSERAKRACSIRILKSYVSPKVVDYPGRISRLRSSFGFLFFSFLSRTAEGGKERKGQSSQAGLIDSAYQPSLTLRLRERGRIFGALASRVSSLSYFLKVSMSFNFLMSALLCKVC